MTAAATFGRQAHLIWTCWIGTGLGRPVLLLGARWAGGVEVVVFEVKKHESLPLEIGSVAAHADILLADVASEQVKFGQKLRREGRCRVVVRYIPIEEVAGNGEHFLVIIFMARKAPHNDALRALVKVQCPRST